MRFTYIASANSSTNGQAIYSSDEVAGAATGRDIYVKKILVGAPVAASTITLYNGVTAFTGQTTEIAYKHTQPTAAAGNPLAYEIDFTSNGKGGLQLDGGNVNCAGSSTDVTVIWQPVDEEVEG